MAQLLYGTGMRLLECCRLRIKDIDFDRGQIVVREGKGDKDRAVPYLKNSGLDCRSTSSVSSRFTSSTFAGVWSRVAANGAGREVPRRGPRTGLAVRVSVAATESRSAGRRANAPASSPGREHADISTTQIYTHVLQRGASGVVSPLDRL